MTVYNGDLFSNQNVSKQREKRIESWKNDLVVEYCQRQIVYFQPIGHMTNTLPAFVLVCHNNHLMPSLNEALRQTPDVHLDTAHVRVEKV